MAAGSAPDENHAMKSILLSQQVQSRAFSLLVGCALSLFGMVAFAQSNTKAAKFYEDALIRYEKKDLPGTIIQLKNALQIDPSMLQVHLLLGKALMQNGEVAAAEVALTEALRLGVNRAEVVGLLGGSYLAQGKNRAVIESDALNPAGLPPSAQLQIQLMRAASYTDLGESRNAMRAIEEARAIDSRSPDVWFAEVPIRIRARQFKEANAAAEKGLSLLPPSSDRWWYQKGSIQHAQGDITGALESYGKVLLADAKHVEARMARIGIYMDLAKYVEAGNDIAELQALQPNDPRAAYMKALLAERRGDTAATNAALKEVTDLLDPVPMDFIRYRPQVLMLNGLAHYGLGQPGKAKQYLEAFQKVQGDSPTAKLLARIYISEGNPATAATLLESYLRAQPGDGQAITLLASAHMALGRPAKAAALLKEALKTQDAPSFRSALGISLVGDGKAASGIAELEAAYKKDPRQIQAGSALVQLYLSSGQSRKAIPVAQGLIKLQANNASFHNLLGMALGQSGNAAGSQAAFEKALQLNQDFTPAKLNLARLEISMKALDAAINRLNDVLKTEPTNSEAMFELAVIADRKGQQAEALRWLEKARDAAGPKELRWGLALVDFHLRYGRPGPALEAAKAASSKAPEDVPSLLAYSRAQLANGDTDGAKSTLTGATRFAGFDAAKQLEIARLQMAANNPAGAAYSLDKALSNDSDNLPAQTLMTEVELRLGDISKAEKRAKDIVMQYPKKAVGYSLQGDIAMAKGQSAAAIEAYRRAHQAEPSTGTLLRLFAALSTQDGGKPALQLAEQWLKVHPKDVTIHRAIADGHARAGNFQAARPAYEAVLKLNPADSDALNNLANVQLRLKDPASVKTAEAALASAPGNALLIDTLGWALFQNGQPDRALQLLRDARLRLPGNPEIRYHLAAVLAKTGRNTEAKDELDAAIKSGLRFESQAEAKALLSTLR